MYINEAMSTQVKTCHSDSNLEDVARLMWDNDCGAIPVVNAENKPVGIVTDRDITMAAMLNHQPLWHLQAAQVVQGQRLCCCHQEEALESGITAMEQNGVRRLLVTNEDGSLAGILSMGDALAFARSTAGAGGKPGAVDLRKVLGMLQKVSAHHEQGQKPLVSA
ncbi:MAG: CBS domain-containing protein [Pseudomonadales bacterium]|nr:CBS domain-containing protein [Pseudomonadales bacterium]